MKIVCIINYTKSQFTLAPTGFSHSFSGMTIKSLPLFGASLNELQEFLLLQDSGPGGVQSFFTLYYTCLLEAARHPLRHGTGHFLCAAEI